MRRFVSVVLVVAAACSGSDSGGGRQLPPPPPPTPELALAPQIYLTEGRPASLYFENITLAERASDFSWDVTTIAVGQQLEDRWTYTPGSLAARMLGLSVLDQVSFEQLATGSTSVSVAPAGAGAGLTLPCVFVGDSITNAAGYIGQMLSIASGDAMKFEPLGTRMTNGVRHEGRPGWTVARYTSDFADASGSNPFWIGGKVDFPGYLAANGLPAPAWVFIQLGTNDVFSAESDAEAIERAGAAFSALDVLIASALAAGPEVRVGLMTPPPPSASQDAFGADYGSAQTRWRYKRNVLLWNRELLKRYPSGGRVDVVPVYLGIDTVSNMANGIHPSAAGHAELGEAVWAFLKNQY